MTEAQSRNLALDDVRHPIATAATLPPDAYTSDRVLTDEVARIFQKHWIGVGRADRVKNPGDFAAMDIAGIPVVLVRDSGGVLRAHANTCRHRSAQIKTGEGNCKRLVCPFHAWTYALDGSLIGAPNMEKAAGFDKSDFPLVSFRAGERDGFAFICMDENAPDIDTWLGDFPELHRPWNLGGHVSTYRTEFEVACNWKTFLEVFNEYYHLPYVHPDSIDSVYKVPDAADDVTGSYTTQFGETEGTGGLLETQQASALPTNPSLDGRNRHGTRYTWIYPNMTFAASTEGTWVYETLPLTPDRCRVGMTVTFPEETTRTDGFEEKSAIYVSRMHAAVDEDIPMLEQQQIGLKSPFARKGRFCEALEPSVANFACWYAEQMRAGA
ncbi:MAG: aromatic ring-hydroxylating oxygenase subunit alpha [Hyphomicrobiaceae bacterium]